MALKGKCPDCGRLIALHDRVGAFSQFKFRKHLNYMKGPPTGVGLPCPGSGKEAGVGNAR